MLRTFCALAAIAAAAPAAAQSSAPRTAETPPTTVTTVTPVAPPATVVTPVAPDAAVVTRVPGIAAVSSTKIQTFGDYDIDDNGFYGPMEFAQAMAFLAAAKPADASLPAKDKFKHKGAIGKLAPRQATAMLNATADEFAMVDMNNDWRVSPPELTAAAMM